MLRKYLSFLVLLLLIPFNSFAISMFDIESDPERYVTVAENDNLNVIVDTHSIQILRENAPFYTLTSCCYLVDFNRCLIGEIQYTIDYDYGRSVARLVNLIISRHPDAKEVIAKNPRAYIPEIKEELIANTGMVCSMEIFNVYNYEGSIVKEGDHQITKNSVMFDTTQFHVGNYMFKKKYHKDFLSLEQWYTV